MLITELPTPQVLVDHQRLLNNIDRVQAAATAGGKRLRPHAKTHKSPVIARWQLDRGAVGVCCQKLGEAEVFARAGIGDIRLPYPVNPFNAPRVLALMDAAAISIIVDNLDVARGWSSAMSAAGRTLDVLIKVDVGFHRCGIDPTRVDARTFVREVAGLRGLRFRGLLSHAGHAYSASTADAIATITESESKMLNDVACAARQDGIEVAEISVGSTPTLRFSFGQPGVTELRPGNYAYFDRKQVALGSAHVDQCALTVMATVVSKPAPERIILDCGSKTLSSDLAGAAPGHGWMFPDLEAPVPDLSLVIERLSEEHAVVKVTNGTTMLKPGDRVRVLPNHACVVSNLVNEIRLVEGKTVVDTLPVEARGRIS